MYSRGDESSEYREHINHFSDPTIRFYKDGELHDQLRGFSNEDEFSAILEQLE